MSCHQFDAAPARVTATAASVASVVLFGSYDEVLHPRVAVLREGLVEARCQVRTVNEPLGASTADKVAAAGALGPALRFVGRVARSSWRLQRRGRRIQAPDAFSSATSVISTCTSPGCCGRGR